MEVNDRIIPKDVSWADYCDALAIEALLESQKRSLLVKKLNSRVELREKSKNAQAPEEVSTLNRGL